MQQSKKKKAKSLPLTREKFRAILAMIKAGEPQIRIAKKMQCSRDTILTIANGQHVFQREEQFVSRCPECGAMVQMPCIACATRAHAKQEERIYYDLDADAEARRIAIHHRAMDRLRRGPR